MVALTYGAWSQRGPGLSPALPSSLTLSMEERGRVNAEGNQRGHRKTESIVPMGRWGHSKTGLGREWRTEMT
jgi:hypothetical protein